MKTKVERELVVLEKKINEIKQQMECSSYLEEGLVFHIKELTNTTMPNLKKDLDELLERESTSMSTDALDLNEKFKKLYRALNTISDKLNSPGWKTAIERKPSSFQDKEVIQGWPSEAEQTTKQKWTLQAEQMLELVNEFLSSLHHSKLETSDGKLASRHDVFTNFNKLKSELSRIANACPRSDTNEIALEKRCLETYDSLFSLADTISLKEEESNDRLRMYESKSKSIQASIAHREEPIILCQIIEKFLQELKQPDNYVFIEQKKIYDALVTKWEVQLTSFKQKIEEQKQQFEIAFMLPITQNLHKLREERQHYLTLLNETLNLLNQAKTALDALHDPKLHSLIQSNFEKIDSLLKDYTFIQNYMEKKLSKKKNSFYRNCLSKIREGSALSPQEIEHFYSKKKKKITIFEKSTPIENALNNVFESSCPFFETLKARIEQDPKTFKQLSKKRLIDYTSKDIEKTVSILPDGDELISLLREWNRSLEHPSSDTPQSSSSPF